MQKAADQNLSEEDTSEFVLNMMLAPDGPVMEMLRPFLSEQLGLEALLDVQPGGILLGGRGGRTAEGVRIYSESDDVGDKLQKSLHSKEIATMIHYPIPIHLQNAYKNLGHTIGDFPITEKCANEILSLPMFPELESEQIKEITDCIRNFKD